ncbi:unnamed protein product [Allacma fusca]|uniref:Uncharacterized protein n=1 Tax=Allacma fusca TaxID=39272 RepID=A0A8J2JAU3_9HEXA|nr:unnamed protein product [Allacma fusca]
MKAIVALIFLGVVAISYAGLAYSPLGYAGAPLGLGYAGAPLALPYAYTAGYGYSALGGNYQLKLDTTLPGSAYASYPYAAAPTAYGYGVIKTV